MKPFDVIVVGAGPAGSMAAKSAAEQGARVLMLEKDRDVGLPVRCAEGVGEIGLRAAIGEINPRWICQKIYGVQLVSPDQQMVTLEGNQMGFVLNRKVFDYDLAQMAADAGAIIRTKAFVHGLLFENNRVTGVRYRSLGQEYQVAATVIIGADGVESRIGRWAGLRQHFEMEDIETCAQVTAAHIGSLDPRYCYFYFGHAAAPGGYVWAFSKGGGVFNIGLGIGGDHAGPASAMDYLQNFLQRHFPDAAILTTVVGSVPCAPGLKQMVGNGVMLVGDAAHQSNPVSGGGIVRAILAGSMAGRVAAEAVKAGDVSTARLNAYTQAWYQGEGRTHHLFYKIKQGIYRLTDDDLNRTAQLLNAKPMSERTLVSLFKSALLHQPGLILDVIKAFT
ncbi:NAD(P)/FAD-dependent oxidoreductase [candidate division KSB1 bacterium]|nr:NAD(P)/FAD-dependent oxidoreductase [candidate division KSB1 bacterium]